MYLLYFHSFQLFSLALNGIRLSALLTVWVENPRPIFLLLLLFLTMERVSPKMSPFKAAGIDIVNNGWYWFSSPVIFLAYNSTWWLSFTYLKWICESFRLSALYLSLCSQLCQSHFALGARWQETNHLNRNGWWCRVGPSYVTEAVLLIFKCGDVAGSWAWAAYFVTVPVTLLPMPAVSNKMEHRAANNAKTSLVSLFVVLEAWERVNKHFDLLSSTEKTLFLPLEGVEVIGETENCYFATNQVNNPSCSNIVLRGKHMRHLDVKD